ncbi:hypothetical protein [Streptomyces sp. NBC_00078]|uniref:hypothetical protein n=1 Tax=Streptomyces sp. NBC_00078 TaxID=2975643 RepID=UPI002253D9E4|nr:hypothetical protein [Streptomyces sp. NBC_00078]MCX5426077.1 hypothetical protein [Streptomyces sp. NBC_00078]
MNLDQIPASPIYTIIISSNGVASIDGQEVTEPGLTPDEARVEALAEVRIKAAYVGRPVRVIAKDTSGTEWPLVVDADGTVTTLDHQHPTPPAPPAQAAPEPPSAPPADDGFSLTVEAPNWAPPSPYAQQPDGTPAGFTDPVPLPPLAAPAPRMSSEWAAPLPAPFQTLFRALVAQEKGGALVEAIIAADQLENALAQQYGPHHPYTVNVMTTRAAFTLRTATTEWAEVTELLIQTAQRRQEAKAQPEEDTHKMIRNAHAAWRKLTAEDPEYARELADQLMGLLGDDNRRARDVVRWIEGGAAA